MAAERTFGWVQNPGDLTKLKKVVGIFQSNSKYNMWLRNERLPLLLKYGLISQDNHDIFEAELSNPNICIKYGLLKGKGAGSGGRSSAICTGIVQAVIDGQQYKTYVDASGTSIRIKKPYTDDWSAEGFIRWAISCGLIEYNKDNDSCNISTLGEFLAGTADDSAEENEAFTQALLSYPPVIRILDLLDHKDRQTKFELGSKLGFKGELGFTSIPQELYLCDYCEAPTSAEKNKIRSNFEGDSDKYARGIASWCAKMGWVESENGEVTGTYRGKNYSASLQQYTITRAGERALKKARGNSSNPRLPRTLMFEMLASNKAPGADYLRYQRAAIIKSLSSSPKTIPQLQTALKGQQLELDAAGISDHIDGLKSIGVEIRYENGKYKLYDKIERLVLPPRSSCIKDSINDIKDRIRPKLTALNHKYLVLVDLAYSDAASTAKKNADALEFEIQTSELFTKELSFNGSHLGGSNKPDVITYYGDKGTIIDNKSYKDGFNIGAHQRDEMSRYVNENIIRSSTINPNEWWLAFDSKVKDFTFMFVTSYLRGNFESQLEYISRVNGGIQGGAISVENLLYCSESLKRGDITYDDFYDSFTNREMIFAV